MADTLPSTKDDVGGESKRMSNRKKINPSDLKKLAPQQRSRYLAYEDPPKHIQEAQQETKKRLLELKKEEMLRDKSTLSQSEEAEREKHAKLIGQLKAAEARNRLRIMRLRYEANRAQEITHLIACQPMALKAVRLQALVPPYEDPRNKGDQLDKLDRLRVQSLLEDTKGLLTNRT